jgi:cytochrome d ubiquinol oxidase subunit II
LTSRALPFEIASAEFGIVSLVMLMRAKHANLTRFTAVMADATVIISWGVAQWDYILPETLTLDQAAAPSGTMGALIVATIGVVILIVPSFILLYRMDQGGLLPQEGTDGAESA